jgi:tetratricopeptide (TPR) repeat protein
LSHAGRFADKASLVRYLTIAGDRAFDAAAFDDAVTHFEHALVLIPVAADQYGRAQLLERLSMALRSVGRWDDALRTMYEALDRYEALGRAEDIGRLGWAMVYQLTWNGRLIEAVAVGRRALAPLGEARERRQGPPAVRAGTGAQHQRLRRRDRHVRPGAGAR